jgi:kynurenine formamidase
MGRKRLIDLTMEIYQGMPTYPSVSKPLVHEMENHEQMARSMGTVALGITHLPNHCLIVSGDHIGTHMDALGHVRPGAPRAEGIPLEYCYGDGVVLDLSAKLPGEEITPSDIEAALERIGYRVKPLDIVLIRTDAAKKRFDRSYLTDHPGMTKEAVHLLLDQGVKLMGIDAIGFDPPVPNMFERRKFWEAHMVMLEREYYHIENLCNLDQIPTPFGFTFSALPIPYRSASAAPVRAVAIVEDDA